MYSGLSYEYMIRNVNKITLLLCTGVGFNIFNPSFGKEFNIYTGITVFMAINQVNWNSVRIYPLFYEQLRH